MFVKKDLGLDKEVAINYSIRERVHMRDMKTGKEVLLPLWTEGKRLLFLGRSTMLYLIFVRWTFFFFLLLSVCQIPQCYFYFSSNNTADQNIWYKFSIANWKLNEDYRVNIAVGALEIFNLLLVIVYIRVFLWWIKRNSKLTEDTIVTTGDFSVEVIGVPAKTVELKFFQHFKNFFSRFGIVNNVALALDSEDIVSIKRKMEHYEKLVKITSLRCERAKHFVWLEKLKLKWYQWKYSKKVAQFKRHIARERYKCIGYAYVTFDTELARWQCLNTFNKPLLTQLCSKTVPRYFGTKFKVNKSEEPSNVLWENVGYSNCSRGLRRLLGVFVTLAMVAVSVGLSALLISQRDVFKFDKAGKNSGGIANSASVINANLVGSLIMSFLLFAILQTLQFLLFHVNFFEKHRYKSVHRRSLMIKAAIGSFLCAIVTYIPYLRADKEAPEQFTIPWKIHGINNGTGIPTVFTEDSAFYYAVFNFLITAIICGILKEAILGPFHWLIKQYNTFQALTQEDLNWAYEPPKYSLHYRYSSLLSIICIALAFSGMFPMALWIMAVGLFFIFFVDKYNLLRIYKKESYAKDLMAANAVRTLAVGYFFRFFVMWFLLAYKAIAKSQYVYNGFLYMITISLAIALLYLVFQSIFAYANIFSCLCCSHFRRAKFLTEKGQVSITRFKEMEKFDPPVKPEDVYLNRSNRQMTIN